MEIFFQGLEVPSLGSPRDIVFRSYLSHKAKISAKKTQLDLMIAVASPTFTDTSKQRSWSEEAKGVFEDYVTLLFGYQTKPRNLEEQKMLSFYTDVVKKSAPILSRGSDGKLKVRMKFTDAKENTLKDSHKIGARKKN